VSEGDVSKLIAWDKHLKKERFKMIEEIVMLVWYMRGGLTWNEAMDLSYDERKAAFDFINNRMEKIKDHSFPVY